MQKGVNLIHAICAIVYPHGIDLGVSGLWFLICLLYKFQAINTNDLTLSPNLLILKYKSFNVKCKSFDSRYKSFGVKPFVQKIVYFCSSVKLSYFNFVFGVKWSAKDDLTLCTNDLTILLEICPGWHAIVYSDKHRFTEEGWSYNIKNHIFASELNVLSVFDHRVLEKLWG